MTRDALSEFIEYVGKLDELTLFVLKGHLVLERGLDATLEEIFFHSTFLDAANLRFVQKVQLARSLSVDQQDNGVWNLILAINTLRNDLAHSLVSPKRRARIDAVRDLYFALYSADRITQERSLSDEVIVSFAIAMSNGFLTMCEAEAKELRRAMNQRASQAHDD